MAIHHQDATPARRPHAPDAAVSPRGRRAEDGPKGAPSTDAGAAQTGTKGTRRGAANRPSGVLSTRPGLRPHILLGRPVAGFVGNRTRPSQRGGPFCSWRRATHPPRIARASAPIHRSARKGCPPKFVPRGGLGSTLPSAAASLVVRPLSCLVPAWSGSKMLSGSAARYHPPPRVAGFLRARALAEKMARIVHGRGLGLLRKCAA